MSLKLILLSACFIAFQGVPAFANESFELECSNGKGNSFELEANNVFRFSMSRGTATAIIDGKSLYMGCEIENSNGGHSNEGTKNVTFHCGTNGYIGSNYRYEAEGYKTGNEFVVNVTGFLASSTRYSVSEIGFPVPEMKCTE